MESIEIRSGNNNDLIDSQREFNKKCRRISIKNMPQGINNQAISDLLKPYHYQQIHIDKMSQSCKAVLLDGDSASRCMSDLHQKLFRCSQLIVSLASCDFMLCITQLPPLYTHEQFLTLITPFGTPERCFLVHSEVSGESKGYGCVEFTSKESSIKAKNHLNGKTIGPHTLQVHWLDTIPTNYSGLHSRCLLVENLPCNFKDSHLLQEFFTHENVKPIFTQIANCSENEFGVLEFTNNMQAEECWRRMNNYTLGVNSLRVSFCVPGPCGLVILNSLKASRDLKRNNPSGGLLPTPIHKIDGTHSQNMMSQGMNPTFSTVNGVLGHPASKDPEVQRLLKALHVRLRHVPPGSEPNQQFHQNELFQAMSHQMPNIQQPATSETHGMKKGFDPGTLSMSNHLMPMRSARGRSASYDSGVQATDDEVFSSNNSSQEDMRQISDAPENIPTPQFTQNQTWNPVVARKNENPFPLDFTAPAFLHRNLKFDISTSRQQWNYQHGITACQREELQRSDSADSAYGGSQESTTSIPDIHSERSQVNNNHFQMNTQQHSEIFPTTSLDATKHPILIPNHGQNGILGEHPSMINPNMQLTSKSSTEMSYPGIFANPQTTRIPISHKITVPTIMQRKTTNGNLQKSISHGGAFLPPSTSTCFNQSKQPMQKVSSAPIVSCNNVSPAIESTQNGIPRPEFLFRSMVKSESLNLRQGPDSLPIFTSNPNITQGFPTYSKVQSSKLNGGQMSQAFMQHRSRKCTTPVQELLTPRMNRKTSFSSLTADLHDIGADSPTQLQLLGSSLMAGLLGDSPRSGADSLSESMNGGSSAGAGGRLIRALNLFSPTECLNSPHTPTSVRKRWCGMLPSPEPSPEAGAYVGQHSQGLGGHYADTLPLILLSHKRRRSNET